MTSKANSPDDGLPPIGVAQWLLKGGKLADRIEWLIRNGFQGVSLLQYVMDCKPKEREDAAAAIKSSGFYVTYHGNVPQTRIKDGKPDADFVRAMIDNVIWWHENTNGVHSCCSDPLVLPGQEHIRHFDYEANRGFIDMLEAGLRGLSIKVGLENSHGGPGAYRTLDNFTRFKSLCAPGVGMLLDAGHANIHVRSGGVEGETEIGAYVCRLPFEVLEVHFSDNRGLADEHRHLGYGNLDLRSLFRALKQVGFKGKFTIEVCLDAMSRNYAADISDAGQTDPLLVSRDAIRSLWAEA